LGHRFTSAAQWSARFDDPNRDHWQRPEQVVQRLDLTAGMTVADVGAGTGYFVKHLTRAVGPTGIVYGLDIEPDMIRYLKRRAAQHGWANVRPLLVSPADPGLAPRSVDRILILNTWHHIPERGRYAAKLRRALKPKGLVVIVDYTLESERGPPKNHYLPPARVIEELGQGGLQAEQVAESLPDQYIVIGRLKSSR